MLSTDLAPSSAVADPGLRVSRLIVTRRGVDDSIYRALGYLDKVAHSDDAPSFEFTYLAKAAADPKFVPVVGFRDAKRRYRSTRLFPSFADRVMSAKRPDRPQYLEALDLESDADAWEILSASGGHREGDPIELISLPEYDGTSGSTTAHFLAHGVRHRSDEASERISALVPGQRLTLEPEPMNKHNPKAIRVSDGALHLGFVPDPLLDYVHAVIDCGGHKLRVVRANSAEAHPHLRLLLRLDGSCERFVFDGPDWIAAA